MNGQPLHCRLATLREIYQLRLTVLRPGHATLDFPGDEDVPPRTWHFGAFTPAGENIACLTLLASTWEDQPALQLRGMAVAAQCRGTGVGTRLLRAAEDAVASHPFTGKPIWWCNARSEAIAFYQKNNWRVASEEFMIEGVGPHRKMVRC